MSVSGRSAITTAAAWIEELRTIPSSPGDLDDLLRDRVLVDLGAQRLAGLQAVLEARRAALIGIGDQLRQLVAGAVVEAEHARRVARRRAREHLAEGDDLRDRLLAVLLGHVADHALAAATEKSMSMSGIDTRSGFRKRSNSRS
jgi:hypothetical protein